MKIESVVFKFVAATFNEKSKEWLAAGNPTVTKDQLLIIFDKNILYRVEGITVDNHVCKIEEMVYYLKDSEEVS